MPPALRPAAQPDLDSALAISAWNLCGGMEWAAMPIAFDILGIRDVEKTIRLMAVIRDTQGEK